MFKDCLVDTSTRIFCVTFECKNNSCASRLQGYGGIGHIWEKNEAAVDQMYSEIEQSVQKCLFDWVHKTAFHGSMNKSVDGHQFSIFWTHYYNISPKRLLETRKDIRIRHTHVSTRKMLLINGRLLLQLQLIFSKCGSLQGMLPKEEVWKFVVQTRRPGQQDLCADRNMMSASL